MNLLLNGVEAFEQIRGHHADLVLLDMMLGDGIGGFEMYRKMIEVNPNQKAVIVSGYSTGEDVRKTLELGACAIIGKPYAMAELGWVVKACLEKGSQHE